MKRLLLIGLLLCAHGAFAATRCVPNITAMDCNYSYPSNSPDVISICTNGSITTTVISIGICASDSAEYGDVADTIHISVDSTENTQCWCRMLSPAVSKWVAARACDEGQVNCAYNCGLSGYGSSIFRNSIMNNLI